ncbi:MAG TPA: MarR family transcriptional regulator [Polyangia bacterium]|nr:MarR family transcriptional regulator [Polyangia bacterium]
MTPPSRPAPPRPRDLALLETGRAYTTAAVMFHAVVAERFGLSATDLKALDLLQRRGPLSAGEIAAHTNLATASVTSLLDRLERRRLVRRQRDRRDRRRLVVTLTPALEQAIAPLFAGLGGRMLARFRRYTDAEVATISRFLEDGAAELREEAAKLPPSVARRRRR